MRWRTRSAIAAGLALTWSVPAHACGMWFNSTFLTIPANPVVSAGLQSIGDYMIIIIDAAIKAGDKFVVRPGVGLCSYSGGSSESNPVYGVAAAMEVWKDAAGKIAVNAQVGAELDSYDGGSERNIPIGAAVRYAASEMVDIFGGANINLYNDSFGGQSHSSTDPALFAGAAYKTGKFRLTGGITMYMYDGGSETAFNVGGGMAMGSAANAIKSIGSLLRR